MRMSKLGLIGLCGALVFSGAGSGAKAESLPPKGKPAPYHIYLHIRPSPDANDDAEQARRRFVEQRFVSTLALGGPPSVLRDRLEQTLDGHRIVRWTVKAWTPKRAKAHIGAAKSVFARDEKVSISLVPVEYKTVEVRDPDEIAQKLRTDIGAVHAWYRERFGPSFPRELLTSEDGGAVFDFSDVRRDSPGLDSAGVLFDATGRPRDASAIDKRIRLARAKPGAQPGVNLNVKEPPPPLKFDGAVLSAAENAETQDS